MSYFQIIFIAIFSYLSESNKDKNIIQLGVLHMHITGLLFINNYLFMIHWFISKCYNLILKPPLTDFLKLFWNNNLKFYTAKFYIQKHILF